MTLLHQFIENPNLGLPRYSDFELKYVLEYHQDLIDHLALKQLEACHNSHFLRVKPHLQGLMAEVESNSWPFQRCCNFAHQIALQALNQHKLKIYENACPQCSRLRRTPKAKICMWCGFSQS